MRTIVKIEALSSDGASASIEYDSGRPENIIVVDGAAIQVKNNAFIPLLKCLDMADGMFSNDNNVP